MAENANKQLSETPRFDPLIQTENIAFDRGDLVACGRCGRLNPPNRQECIYCAESLNNVVESLTGFEPNPRKPEAWERGFNLILRKRASASGGTRAAGLLSLETDDLAEIVHAGTGLPLAWVKTEKEAARLRMALMDIGLECSVVSDDELAAERLPTRVGGLDFLNYQLAIRNFNTGEISLIGYDQIALIVRGQISRTRVDSNEKKRRGSQRKLIDEYSSVSDESVVDIYTSADKTGFRINPAGFDFSCLGAQKALLARDNFGRLVNLLTEHSPRARLVSNYTAVSRALRHVWEIETRKDSLGLRQIAIGKREFGSIASTSNLTQFTKFSRLQWHLL